MTDEEANALIDLLYAEEKCSFILEDVSPNFVTSYTSKDDIFY